MTAPARMEPSAPPSRRGPPRKRGLLRAWRALFAGYVDTSPPKPQRKTHRGKGYVRPSARSQADESTAPRGPQTPVGLGTPHLGKFAHEKEMPGWLVRVLDKGGQVCAGGILPVLEQLLEKCPSTRYAYLCHPSVQHVSKLRREGAFCGYRNIQMLISYLVGTGSWQLGDTFPSVFEIQDLIEHAWDKGFNTQGRVETGGIRGTRKFIGTPEAHALFRSLDIPCSAQAFRGEKRGEATSRLIEAIEAYFESGWQGETTAKVRSTALPPIYLQHHGHSVTIVGIERQQDDQVNVLVFDPSCGDSVSIKRLIGNQIDQGFARASRLLEPYRCGIKYLSKHDEFEILRLLAATNSA